MEVTIIGKIQKELSEKEAHLIEELRLLAFGKILIHMENNQPVRIEEIRENIKL